MIEHLKIKVSLFIVLYIILFLFIGTVTALEVNGNSTDAGIINSSNNSSQFNPNIASNNTETTSNQCTVVVINNSTEKAAAGEITPIFTLDQISDAAFKVKNNIEINCNLPSNVTINGTTMNMAQFLELMMTATLQINGGNNNSIPLRTYNNPNYPIDDIKSGNIIKSEFLKIANDLKTYMDTTGKTPDYQYQTSLGVHLGFQNLIYMYSKLLFVNKVANYLPNFVEMRPWSSIGGQSVGIIPNGPTFTIDQIAATALSVKNYVESNNRLPTNVSINGTTMNLAQFLELMMTATQQINGGNNNLIPLRVYNNPNNPLDDIRAGNIQKAEFLKIANDLKTYMDSTGRTPDYQYQTSLGTHLGFQNLIYMYSKLLYVYNVASYLPNFVEMKSWSSITSQSTGIIPNGPILALDQIKDAASTVKNYIDLNSKLPDNVTVNGTTVNMAQFLELLMTVTLQINSGNDNSIPLRTYNNPINPIDDINEGNVFKTEYLKIANDLKTYMDTTGRTPDYQYQTTLGTHLGFQNLIYMYSRVLDSYNRTSKLPDFVSMESWRFITSPTLAIFTVDQIEDAAVEVKSYIENNANFLDNVTINGTTVKMSGFLELLMTATLHVNSGNNDHILLKNYTSPSNPMDSIRAGNIFKAEYLKIANDLKAYMDTTGRTPDYQYQSSLGVYLGFQNLVYMYCNMMNFYKVAHYLPDYAVMKPWYAVIKSYKIDVIISGTGGYITNNAIVGSYIQRTELTDIILAAAVTGTPMLTFGDGYGPYVMIVAGVHGNELPAQIAAIKLANYLKGKTFRGTIYIIPFVIPSSTATSSRYWNGMNLNSVANVPGTPTNQILNLARLLNVNALGDFHSTQPGGVPGQDTAMCSLNPTYESYRIASSVSSQTGSVLNSYNRAGVDYPGALEDVCNLSGVPAVTCEVLCSHGTADNYTINKSYNQMIAFLHYENII